MRTVLGTEPPEPLGNSPHGTASSQHPGQSKSTPDSGPNSYRLKDVATCLNDVGLRLTTLAAGLGTHRREVLKAYLVESRGCDLVRSIEIGPNHKPLT